MMWSFFSRWEPSQSPVELVSIEQSSIGSTPHAETTNRSTDHIGSPNVVTNIVFTGYLSDLSSESDLDVDNSDNESEDASSGAETLHQHQFRVQQPPPLKWCQLEIPTCIAHQRTWTERQNALKSALDDIEKLIQSKMDFFDAGQHGLQAYWVHAIQSYLWMVMHNKKSHIEASQQAAESQGFAEKWGGRTVHCWVRKWVEARELPVSSRGHHAKTFSLYDDPAVRDELRSFVRSNKWAINPEKLVEFSKNKMVPTAAKQYIEHITNTEMPRGLKKYMEVELFPHIQLKPSKGVSLATARCLLRQESFQFQEHKKSLYYDGHEQPDVVEDHQKRFLPAMAKHAAWLVEYVIGDIAEELLKTPANYVERRLVLCAHDKMTAQANDGLKRSWVLDGEQPLQKKGAGHGLHQSDVICSTVGWLQDVSHTLEYGKNYDGYWTGELFVKQVFRCFLVIYPGPLISKISIQLKEKIIPSFEHAHGAGY